MTVQTLPTHNSGPDGSSKLLINNGNSTDNTESTNDGMSFNATMNQTVSDSTIDEKKYLLPDGQTLTAEQLLEMLQSGKTLPGLNLPSVTELQQLKFKSGLEPQMRLAQFDARFDTKNLHLEPSRFVMNDKFSIAQQTLNAQYNQNQFLKSGGTIPEQFLATFNSVNAVSQQSPEVAATGFTTAYGYQLTNGIDGVTTTASNSMNITTPVQHPQWNQSLGQSVQWMVNQNLQQAEIKLNPPDFGMLDIKVSITNDQATIHFSAANSAVRDAIESAMPRLRDMLEASGVSLADVNVSEHSLDNGKPEQDAESEAANGQMLEELGDDPTSILNASNKAIKLGLLDIYA